MKLSDKIEKIATNLNNFKLVSNEETNKIIKKLENTLKEFKKDLKQIPKTEESELVRKFYNDKIKLLTKDLEYWKSMKQ